MFRATTTGVLVKDGVGNEFMTVAAPGFPGECGTDVNLALPTGGRKIGEVNYEVSHRFRGGQVGAGREVRECHV